MEFIRFANFLARKESIEKIFVRDKNVVIHFKGYADKDGNLNYNLCESIQFTSHAKAKEAFEKIVEEFCK